MIRFPLPLLAALTLALSSAGCVGAPGPAPRLVLAPEGASLTLTITGAYNTQYLRVWDWDVAEATVTSASGLVRAVRAEAELDPETGRRGGTFRFEGLPVGTGFRFKLALFRQAGETLTPLAEAERTDLTLALGSNALALAAGSLTVRPALAAPQALLPGFVTSIPGVGMTARVNAPGGVAVGPDGAVYVSDTGNGCIRRVAPDARGRWVSTMYAGTGLIGFADGAAEVARLNAPSGLTFGADGTLYVADTANRVVRRIIKDAATGRVTVSIVRNAAGAALSFTAPSAVAVSPAGTIYVADKTRLMRVTADGAGFASALMAGDTTAGNVDGAGAVARFSSITALALDGETLWVADGGNGRVRRVSSDGTVSTVATPFSSLTGLFTEGPDTLLVAEATRVRRLRLATGSPVLEEVAGGASAGFVNGEASSARFSDLKGLAADAAGTLYLADAGNHRVRRLTTDAGGVRVASTLVGDGEVGNMNGPAGEALALTRATGLAVEPSGAVVVADLMGHQLVRFVPDGQGDYTTTVLAGTGTAGLTDGAAESAQFNGPASVAIAPDGSYYVSDTGNNCVRRVRARAEGGYTVETAVTGFQFPAGVTVAPDGALYVTEAGHPAFSAFGPHRISKVTWTGDTPTVTILAGTTSGFADGDAATALFNRPTAVAVMPDGTLAIADSDNHRLRRMTIAPDGAVAVTTLAGTGTVGKTNGAALSARFDRPSGLAVDAAGNLFIADYWNHRIRRLGTDAQVTTVAGTGDGYADGPTAQALFSRPAAVALGPDQALYVVDAHRHGVRRIAP